MDSDCTVLVLISGNGTNLQALIDASVDADFNIIGVISNNPQAFGLERARAHAIPAFVINHRDYPDRVSFDQALIDQIDKLNPDLIVLAGFMRILSSEFVGRYPDRILNIHPSLLPKYPGTNTHQRVIDAADPEHGASVHFVTEELDGGPVVAHAKVPVTPQDTADELARKVHEKEYIVYPRAVTLFAEGRLRMHDRKAWLDQQPLPEQGIEVE